MSAQKIMLSAKCVLVSAILAGCASVDEGSIDYRKAEIRTAERSKTYLRLMQKYHRGADDARIQKGDSISITLAQGYIAEIFERPAFWRGETEAKAEMAIVINAFELSGDKDFSFDPGAEKNGRLVYYSDDVREGQYLNFSHMPVYGPITYNGNPIGIQIYIVDIDGATNQLKKLLSVLASTGNEAFAPASPVLNILDNLGSSLIDVDDQDTVFRYSMTLYPDMGYSKLDYPLLEAGNYVFIRNQDRGNVFPWDSVCFNQYTGRLESGRGVACNSFPVEGDGRKFSAEKNFGRKDGEAKPSTYLTVSIQKGLDPTDLDLSQNTFGKFLKSLDQKSIQDEESFAQVFSTFQADYTRIRKFGEIRASINELSRTIKEQTDKVERLANRITEDMFEEVRREHEFQMKLKSVKAENDKRAANGLPKDALPLRPRKILTEDEIDTLLRMTRDLFVATEQRSLVSRSAILDNSKRRELIAALIEHAGVTE